LVPHTEKSDKPAQWTPYILRRVQVMKLSLEQIKIRMQSQTNNGWSKHEGAAGGPQVP
jgi:hypothetical protein